MNTAAFQVVASKHAREHDEVRITIDGADLLMLVAEAERASAAAEGHAALEFEQPHRKGKWSYNSFGPFTFDRKQFEHALGSISSAATG